MKSFIHKISILFSLAVLGISFFSCKQNPEPEPFSKAKCNILIIDYNDGDNDLVYAGINDMLEFAEGLNNADEDLDLRIISLYDGLDPNSEEGKKECSGTQNQSLLKDVQETRLIEIKPWVETGTIPNPLPSGMRFYFESSASEFSFDQITYIDYTEDCGFIPMENGKYELNMSDADNVRKLLDFAYDLYDPKYVFLRVSDHGSGTSSTSAVKKNSRSVCVDETAKDQSIGEDQLRQAIQDSKFKSVDILHFDACLEGTIENAYEFKDCVDYLVASANISSGVPWSRILSKFWGNIKTPRDLALQIVTEAAFEKSNRAPVTKDILNSTRVELNPDYSPTYAVYDLTEKKSEVAIEKLNKVIETIYEGALWSKAYGFMKDVDDQEILKASLSEYIKLHPEYNPSPSDYLISDDFSFLITRNVHGWVGEKSDVIFEPYDLNKDNFGYPLEIPGKMTSMSYVGGYASLLDVGYLMDMLICCTEYNCPDLSSNVFPFLVGDKEVSYKDFVNDCKEVVNALDQLIIYSHRVDGRKTAVVKDYEKIHEELDIDGMNFYEELVELHKSYNDGLDTFHYGISISGPKNPEVETITDISKNKRTGLYKKIGENQAVLEDYNGVTPPTEMYADSCEFLKSSGTKWLDLLREILPYQAIEWSQYDALSSAPLS